MCMLCVVSDVKSSWIAFFVLITPFLLDWVFKLFVDPLSGSLAFPADSPLHVSWWRRARLSCARTSKSRRHVASWHIRRAPHCAVIRPHHLCWPGSLVIQVGCPPSARKWSRAENALINKLHVSSGAPGLTLTPAQKRRAAQKAYRVVIYRISTCLAPESCLRRWLTSTVLFCKSFPSLPPR